MAAPIDPRPGSRKGSITVPSPVFSLGSVLRYDFGLDPGSGTHPPHPRSVEHPCFHPPLPAPGWRALLTATLIALGSLLSGCGGLLPQPPEAPRTYLLAPALPDRSGSTPPLAAPGKRPSLRVSAPRAEPGYDSRRMAYLEQDYRLDSFAAHEWVAAPATLLGPLLAQALRDSGAFAAVSEEERGIDTDLRLDSVIESFYQDFRTRPSQAQVQVRVWLVNPAERRILATQVFSDTQPTKTDDPYGGVIAINQALGRLLPRIADFAAANARLVAGTPASPR